MTEVVQPATVPAPGEVPVVDAKRRPTRVIQLDFLRGVAILMVLGNHSFNIIHPEDAGFFRPLARLFDLFGWTGVDLFFVLSGFLVGGLLLRELQKYGKLDVGRFIIRRGLKIWPSYYIFLFWLLFQGYRATHSWHAALHPLIPNFLHIQNYVLMPEYHTWTLSLEEHFYLFLPLLLWLLMRRRERRLLHLIPAVYLTIAIACLVMRFLILIVYPYHPGMDAVAYAWKTATPTHFRMDALMCGVLLAYLTYFRPETLTFAVGSSQRRWRLFAVGLALVLPMIYFRMTSPGSMMIMNTLGITMLYLGYACILMACVNAVAADGSPGKIFQSLPARLIAIIGFYSYPIYLWHINQGRNRVIHMLYVGKFAHMGASERWLVAVSLYMVIGIAFGIVFSRLLEMPTLALRERFFPGRIRT